MKNIKIIIGIILLTVIGGIIAYKIINKDDTPVLDDGNSKYVNELISKQYVIDKEIEAEVNSKKYDIYNPYIKVNPYEVSPLSALIYFDTIKKESVTLTIKGKKSNDLVYKFDECFSHLIPVFGLYNNYNNTIVLETESGIRVEYSIKTENNISEELNINVAKSGYSDSFYFVSNNEQELSFALDSYGEVRWIAEKGYFKNIMKLDNGHILISKRNNSNSYLTDLIEMDMFGKVYNYYLVGNGLHNNYMKLKNGNILFVSSNSKDSNVGDLIIEMNPENGYIVKTIDILKMIKKIDQSIITDNNIWDINSGLYYDEDSKQLLVSYRGLATVLFIDYKSGELNKMFGNKNNWTESFWPYFLNIDEGAYPKSINNPIFKNNQLTVYDNGLNYYELKFPLPCTMVGENYSNIKIYDIDFYNNKAILKGTSLDNEHTYTFQSFLNDNDTILYGSTLSIIDNTCDLYNYSKYNARILEKKDNNIIFDAKLNIELNSISKLKIYSNNNYNLVKGKLLGDIENIIKSKTIKKYLPLLLDAKEDLEYDVYVDDGYIKINSVFLEMEEVNLILVQDNDGIVLNYKNKDSIIEQELSIIGLSGKYNAYLDINGVIINTRKTLEI